MLELWAGQWRHTGTTQSEPSLLQIERHTLHLSLVWANLKKITPARLRAAEQIAKRVRAAHRRADFIASQAQADARTSAHQDPLPTTHQGAELLIRNNGSVPSQYTDIRTKNRDAAATAADTLGIPGAGRKHYFTSSKTKWISHWPTKRSCLGPPHYRVHVVQVPHNTHICRRANHTQLVQSLWP